MADIFEKPSVEFPAKEFARNKILRAEQSVLAYLQEFKAAYHDFWGLTGLESGSRHSPEELQSIIDQIPIPTFMQITGLASGMFGAMRTAAKQLGSEEMLPEAYGEAAFDVQFDGQRLVVGPLKKAWVKPPEERPTEQ